MSDAPLILTLKLDPVSFERFDGLRRAHFPPALNHIPAHLTLFHKLPGERVEAVVGHLTTSALAGPLQLRAIGLRKLGRGTAFEIDGAALKGWRGGLAARWAEWLTPQDRQPFRPHVTVQNKVEPIAARALFESLSDSFHPFDLHGVGVLVWRYLGGPWRLEAEVGFTPPG
jgi:hypothetical protein